MLLNILKCTFTEKYTYKSCTDWYIINIEVLKLFIYYQIYIAHSVLGKLHAVTLYFFKFPKINHL